MRLYKPSKDPGTDFDRLAAYIADLDTNGETKTHEQLDNYQRYLDMYSATYLNIKPLDREAFMLYELQALIFHLEGQTEDSEHCLQIASTMRHIHDSFISKAAQRWALGQAQMAQAANIISAPNPTHKTPDYGKYVWRFIVAAFVLYMAYALIVLPIKSKIDQHNVNLAAAATAKPTITNVAGYFTVTFPCSDVYKDNSQANGADLQFINYTCSPLDGGGFSYGASITTYVTNKYGTAEDQFNKCEDFTDDEGNKWVKVYNEQSTIQGTGTFNICGLSNTQTGEYQETSSVINDGRLIELSMTNAVATKDFTSRFQTFANSLVLN